MKKDQHPLDRISNYFFGTSPDPYCNTTVAFAYGDRRWVAATTGALFVAMGHDYAPKAGLTEHAYEQVIDRPLPPLYRTLVACAVPRTALTVPVRALKDWLGPAVWPEGKVCGTCHGAGDEDGLGACPGCGGAGYVLANDPETRPGFVKDLLVDRSLAALAAACFEDGDVMLDVLPVEGAKAPALWLWGKEGMAVVMGLRMKAPEGTPRFEGKAPPAKKVKAARPRKAKPRKK